MKKALLTSLFILVFLPVLLCQNKTTGKDAALSSLKKQLSSPRAAAGPAPKETPKFTKNRHSPLPQQWGNIHAIKVSPRPGGSGAGCHAFSLNREWLLTAAHCVKSFPRDRASTAKIYINNDTGAKEEIEIEFFTADPAEIWATRSTLPYDPAAMTFAEVFLFEKDGYDFFSAFDKLFTFQKQTGQDIAAWDIALIHVIPAANLKSGKSAWDSESNKFFNRAITPYKILVTTDKNASSLEGKNAYLPSRNWTNFETDVSMNPNSRIIMKSLDYRPCPQGATAQFCWGPSSSNKGNSGGSVFIGNTLISILHASDQTGVFTPYITPHTERFITKYVPGITGRFADSL